MSAMSLEHTLVLGLDIGSNKISTCICSVSHLGEIHVIGVGSSPTYGLTKGRITNTEDLQRAIEKAIQRAELAANARVSHVITNLPMHGAHFVHHVGLILSKEESGRISEAERRDCLKRSKTIHTSDDDTIVHMIPLYYKVDDTMVQNPVGIHGTRLEVKTHTVLVDSHTLQQTTAILKGLRLQISGIVYDALASAQTLLSDDQLREGAIVLDMGGRFTKVSIFKNNLLQRTLLIPIGGDTITGDIAKCLAIPFAEAEKLKLLYGQVHYLQVNPGEYIPLSGRTSDKTSVQRRLLCEIIYARIVEWMTFIEHEISFDFDPHYHVTLGGNASRLNGLDRFVENTFNRLVNASLPDSLSHIPDGLGYASAIGLVMYGIKSNAIPLGAPPAEMDPFQKFNRWLRRVF